MGCTGSYICLKPFYRGQIKTKNQVMSIDLNSLVFANYGRSAEHHPQRSLGIFDLNNGLEMFVIEGPKAGLV